MSSIDFDIGHLYFTQDHVLAKAVHCGFERCISILHRTMYWPKRFTVVLLGFLGLLVLFGFRTAFALIMVYVLRENSGDVVSIFKEVIYVKSLVTFWKKTMCIECENNESPRDTAILCKIQRGWCTVTVSQTTEKFIFKPTHDLKVCIPLMT